MTDTPISTRDTADDPLEALKRLKAQRARPETTPLPLDQEGAFRQWATAHGLRDIDAPDAHYDYRGAFAAGVSPNETGHWPDTFKQHGHPTFSVESQYSTGANDGGHWNGETFVPPADPLEQLKALKAGRAPNRIHADFASGALQRRTAVANATDPDAGDTETVSLPRAFLHAALATGANVAQGIPGMERAEAAIGAGASHVLGDHPLSYDESLANVRALTDKLPSALRTGERIAGATGLLAIPGAIANPITTGAVLGGADQALSADPMSAGERGAKTGMGAAVGAVLPAVGKGLGNIAQRTGLTDLVARGVRAAGDKLTATGATRLGSLATDLGQAMGTTGAGNDLLADRQAILDRLTGSEKSAAQTMIDHVDQYKAQSRKLYDAAKQDDAVVADPRVQSVLADHRVQQMFQMARERLGLGPNDTVIHPGSAAVPRLLPGPSRPALPSPSSDAPTSTRDAIAAFNARRDAAVLRTQGTPAQQQAREALERRSAEATLPTSPPRAIGASLVANPTPEVSSVHQDLPTPEELAMTKRILNTVVQQKFNAPTGISTAEASQMAPLLDELRSALHDASPAWKDADAFYAHAKNFETAFQKAYGVQQKATAAGLDPNKLKTSDALAAWVAKKNGTPLGIARASGVQAGTAGRLAEAVQSAPLETDIGQTLAHANGVFQPSAAAAKVRQGAFASPSEARSLTDLIAGLTEKSAKAEAANAPMRFLPNVLTTKNPLTTPAGVALRTRLAGDLADPAKTAALRATIASSTRGRSLLDLLRAGTTVGATTAAGQ